jgi:hypothetical protein
MAASLPTASQTFDGTSLGLELPAFAFVALGKHAMTLDVDGNGFFTPGLKINATSTRRKSRASERRSEQPAVSFDPMRWR